MSTLAEVVAAADPALAPYAVVEPGPGRFGAVEGVRGFVLEAVYEGYLMHYGEPRAFTGMDADLRLLDEGAYAELDRLAATLAAGLDAAARSAGVPASAAATTGLLTLFFAPEPPRDYEQAKACDLDAYAAFCRGMLDRGIYLPPSQFEAWFPSLAHTDEHVARTVDAAAEVLRTLA